MQILNRRAVLPSLMLASALLLPACSSGPTPLPPPDTAQVDAWVMRGYLSESRRSVEHQADELAVAGEVAAVEWTLPTQGAALPLVVYLPGLGESARAGARWRDAWASAGYAVLALGTAEDDRPPPELLRRPDRAADGKPAPTTPQELRQRIADQRDALHEWVRVRFEPAAAAARLKRLAAVLGALQARARAQDAVLRRVDLHRVALAGFDAGAYTALLAVGELPRTDWVATPLPLPVQAVICLSPFADFEGTSFSQRYRQVQVPVLSVSGASDVDAAGLVPSPYVRRAPYENLPGHAGLLWLKSASHNLLAGRPQGGRGEAAGGQGGAGAEADARDGGNRRGGDGRGGIDGGGMSAPGGGPGSSGEGESAAGRQRQATDAAIDQAVVAATTTAFLDAELRQDPLARQWLGGGDAARWIHPRGEWGQR